MKIMIVCLLVAAVASANPVLLTILNEVGITDDTLAWFELHSRPGGDYHDLAGAIVQTSTTECTLACMLAPGDFLVITSADIARGINGRGSFRVRSDTDFVRLTYPDGLLLRAEEAAWPQFPTGYNSAPAPPVPGSIARWNEYGEAYYANWYVDSTPTPGRPNDDYSSISGTLTVTGGGRLREATVSASGTYGRSAHYGTGEYTLKGLGAGRYEVRAFVQCDSGRFEAVWPESVEVGYSATVTGTDFEFLLTGVEEPAPAGLHPAALGVTGRTARLRLESSRPVVLDVMDALGRRVAVLHDAPLDAGRHRFELPAGLAAGVYLVRLRQGSTVLTARAVIIR